MNDKTGRGETMSLRASRKQKVLIDRAAEALGRSRSDFMLDTACREAESVLLDRRYFALSEKEFKQFIRILDSPPKDKSQVATAASDESPLGPMSGAGEISASEKLPQSTIFRSSIPVRRYWMTGCAAVCGRMK